MWPHRTFDVFCRWPPARLDLLVPISSGSHWPQPSDILGIPSSPIKLVNIKVRVFEILDPGWRYDVARLHDPGFLRQLHQRVEFAKLGQLFTTFLLNVLIGRYITFIN